MECRTNCSLITMVANLANHHRHHHVEQKLYVDVLVPHEMEEIVHIPKMIPQKRVVQQMVEQIVGVPVPPLGANY